jgi:hypothetical protein
LVKQKLFEYIYMFINLFCDLHYKIIHRIIGIAIDPNITYKELFQINAIKKKIYKIIWKF